MLSQLRNELLPFHSKVDGARFHKKDHGNFFINVPVPILRQFSKKYKDLSKENLLSLLHSLVNEERLLALFIMILQFKKEKEVIITLFLENIEQVNAWNLVDSSAHLILGAYLEDKDRSVLKELARSDNFWKRRVAIVATWWFIRKNDLDWTFVLAEMLLKDSEDLIHKAVGWMLREAGKKDESRLLEFLQLNGPAMPRTMFRYAVEKLDPKRVSLVVKN